MKTENRKDGLKVNNNSEDFPRVEIERIFDIGIQACDQKDTLKVCEVLNTLKGMLSLQYKEVASGFNRLYEFCLKFVNDNNFDKAREILLNSVKVGM